MVGRAGVCDRPSILLYSALLMGFHPLPTLKLTQIAVKESLEVLMVQKEVQKQRYGRPWLVWFVFVAAACQNCVLLAV